MTTLMCSLAPRCSHGTSGLCSMEVANSSLESPGALQKFSKLIWGYHVCPFISFYIHYYLFLMKRNHFFHQKLIVSIKQVELRVFSFTKSTRCWKHHRNVWSKSNKSNDKKYTNRTVRRVSCKLDVAADQTLLPLPRLPSVSPCQTTHTNNYK